MPEGKRDALTQSKNVDATNSNSIPSIPAVVDNYYVDTEGNSLEQDVLIKTRKSSRNKHSN